MDQQEEFGSRLQQELDQLQELTKTQEWAAFLKIMAERKKFLQGQINSFLRLGKYREADRTQAKFEDIDMIFKKLTEKVNNLRDGRR